jgi:hypothetical protein
MPFPLTEPDFFKYCDFLLDEVGTSHFEENIELQRQLTDLKKQFSTIEESKTSLQQENEKFKENNIKLTARVKQFIEESKEQDQFFEELQASNSEQANKLIQQINLNKQLEQSNTELSLKNEQQAGKLEKISKSELKPGDIGFLYGSASNHIGMFFGKGTNGKYYFIHSAGRSSGAGPQGLGGVYISAAKFTHFGRIKVNLID